PDVDPCAIRVENRPLGRVHFYIVVHNDGAYDGPLCNLALHTNACRSSPPGMNGVARDEIRTGACDVNHVSSTAKVNIGVAQNGTRGYHVPLNVRSSVDLVQVDGPLCRVTYCVPGNVHLHLRARYSNAKQIDPQRMIERRSSGNIDDVI